MHGLASDSYSANIMGCRRSVCDGSHIHVCGYDLSPRRPAFAFTRALMLSDEPVSALLISVGIGGADAWARLSNARGSPRKSGPR